MTERADDVNVSKTIDEADEDDEAAADGEDEERYSKQSGLLQGLSQRGCFCCRLCWRCHVTWLGSGGLVACSASAAAQAARAASKINRAPAIE